MLCSVLTGIAALYITSQVLNLGFYLHCISSFEIHLVISKISLKRVQTDSGAHPSSYTFGTGGSSSGCKATRGVKLTAGPHPVPCYTWVELHFHLHIHHHDVYRDNFTFTSYHFLTFSNCQLSCKFAVTSDFFHRWSISVQIHINLIFPLRSLHNMPL
jgi:hypothetical protein